MAASMAFAAAAQDRDYQIAVSPFANAGADKSADYIGFQASEFISNAMAGFPGVRVIERGQLMRILEEQELQLSGVTEGGEGASVGQILDARQIVIGSFALGAATLSLNARLVDVSTGAVLSRAGLEAPRADSYSAAYKALLFQLLSGLPEYKMTIGVEARIEAISGQEASAAAAQASDDYAKALDALYKKDDAAALDYLQKAMSSADSGFVGFAAAADRYVETLAKAKGASRYAKMVQSQVATNKALMEQVEPLSLYRATLKVLRAKAEAIVTPDAFAVAGRPAEAVDFKDGAVSTRVYLPAQVEIALKPEARAALAALFSGQDAARLGSGSAQEGVVMAPLPRGGLLGEAALRGLLGFRLSASISHAVQFLNAKGEVVYELLSDPSTPLSLGAKSASFSARAKPAYAPAAYRDGWALREDGSLEIQARALAELDTVRYALRPESLAKESSIGIDSDLVWRSLVSHAYRKRSIKVASRLDDPAPQFKEVVVTDSFYETADPELGRVPILPRNGAVAGFAALSAVVYFADSAKDAVNVAWSGAVKGQSESFVGEIGPNSVLYFDSPERYGMRRGDLQVTARLGQAEAGKTAAARLVNGEGWQGGSSGDSFLFAQDRFFTDGGQAYAPNGAAIAWKPLRFSQLALEGDILYTVASDRLQRWDRKSCALLGASAIKLGAGSGHAEIANGRLYLKRGLVITALDAASGTKLWAAGDRGDSPAFALAKGRLYSGSGLVYDAATGDKLLETAGRGAIAVADGRAYYANGVCVDLDSGKTIWKTAKPFRSGTPILAGGIVYLGGVAALSALDGTAVWTGERPGLEDAVLAGGRLYANGGRTLCCLDAATGKLLWKASDSTGKTAMLYLDGSLYLDYKAFSRLDLGVFERELEP
jgi:outer membrane protein assembly factor BamB/TolB-like protein